MSKPVLQVKKIGGNTATVFIDPSNDKPVSVTSWEQDAPEGYFPYTANIATIQENLGSFYDLIFLERAGVDLPRAKRVRATEDDLKGIERNVSAPPSSPNAAPQYVPPIDDGNQIVERIMKHVETYLVKLSVAEGKKQKALAEEYYVVKKFVLKLFPALFERIQRLEEEHESGE